MSCACVIICIIHTYVTYVYTAYIYICIYIYTYVYWSLHILMVYSISHVYHVSLSYGYPGLWRPPPCHRRVVATPLLVEASNGETERGKKRTRSRCKQMKLTCFLETKLRKLSLLGEFHRFSNCASLASLGDVYLRLYLLRKIFGDFQLPSLLVPRCSKNLHHMDPGKWTRTNMDRKKESKPQEIPLGIMTHEI